MLVLDVHAQVVLVSSAVGTVIALDESVAAALGVTAVVARALERLVQTSAHYALEFQQSGAHVTAQVALTVVCWLAR